MMRQVFPYESLERLPHVGIISDVVWCDLGRGCPHRLYSPHYEKLLWTSAGLTGKNAFHWGNLGVQKNRVGQVSHEMWFYNTRNEHKAESIHLNTKTDCD